MSNEYKDWFWDQALDIVLERGLVDKITHVEPGPEEGPPCYVWGLKNGEPVKYYVRWDPDLDWLCEHRELDI